MTKKWMVWQVASDRETYGENASGTLIVSADGEHEISRFMDPLLAQTIVDAHNAAIDEIEAEYDAIDTAGEFARLTARALETACGKFGNNPAACDEITQVEDTKGVWD